MAESGTISAWIALFLGLAILAICVAELRAPGGWAKLVEELEQSNGLRVITGFFTVALSAAIYLVNPWNPSDWLSIVVSVIGGLGVAKGLLILAAPHRIIALGRAVLGSRPALIAGIDALLGAALIFAALSRLQTI